MTNVNEQFSSINSLKKFDIHGVTEFIYTNWLNVINILLK